MLIGDFQENYASITAVVAGWCKSAGKRPPQAMDLDRTAQYRAILQKAIESSPFQRMALDRKSRDRHKILTDEYA